MPDGAPRTAAAEARLDLASAGPIFLAGHRGMVGSAIHRKLRELGIEGVITRTRAELDLRDQAAVDAFFDAERPRVVILAAALVGGILANAERPADFLLDNLQIATNVIHASHRSGVRKLLNLGSSCIYPKHAPQPMREEHLLTGPLEPTNRAYAIAKIAAIELCDAYRAQHGDDFVSAMPTNLYGPNDNFDLRSSHVLPALLRKTHEAKARGEDAVEVWGSGRPRREFLHVDDLAEASVFLLENVSEPGPINVGTGRDLTIRELAETIADVVGFEGALRFDPSKPDGTPRKLMDVRRLASLGWSARIGLREGIEATYGWYLANEAAR
jgi:GDP-L-fucose synthase